MKNCYRIVLLSNENNNIFTIENFKLHGQISIINGTLSPSILVSPLKYAFLSNFLYLRIFTLSIGTSEQLSFSSLCIIFANLKSSLSNPLSSRR